MFNNNNNIWLESPETRLTVQIYTETKGVKWFDGRECTTEGKSVEIPGANTGKTVFRL